MKNKYGITSPISPMFAIVGSIKDAPEPNINAANILKALESLPFALRMD